MTLGLKQANPHWQLSSKAVAVPRLMVWEETEEKARAESEGLLERLVALHGTGRPGGPGAAGRVSTTPPSA